MSAPGEHGDPRAARDAEDDARAPGGALCLGIDACSDLLDLAIVDGRRVVAERRMEAASAHCERLLPELVKLLATCERRVQAIGLIGVTAGPGRFTSLRIGLATAQGLAVGLGARVVPVSVFDAAVHAIASSLDAREAPRLVVAVDAGPELQWALYRSSASPALAAERFERIAGPEIAAPEALAADLARREGSPSSSDRPSDAPGSGSPSDSDAPLLVVGSGAERLAAILTRLSVPHRIALAPNLGRAAALLAWERRADAIDPANLAPLYLRPTRAEEQLSHAARAEARN